MNTPHVLGRANMAGVLSNLEFILQLILFTKMFSQKQPGELISLAQGLGVDGFDLCVRTNHLVNPSNVATALPQLASELRSSGLDVPMLTGDADLLLPDHPIGQLILAAMDEADVRMLKIGYFHFNPASNDYTANMDRARRAYDGWQKLAHKYRVKICHHTHSGQIIGSNGSGASCLMAGLDPSLVGVKIDPAHLVLEGEDFLAAFSMVRDYVCIVSLKDALVTRGEKNGHGCTIGQTVEAGQGMVDWTDVGQCLAENGFDGPMSIHCEFKGVDDFDGAVKREVAFFRRWLER